MGIWSSNSNVDHLAKQGCFLIFRAFSASLHLLLILLETVIFQKIAILFDNFQINGLLMIWATIIHVFNCRSSQFTCLYFVLFYETNVVMLMLYVRSIFQNVWLHLVWLLFTAPLFIFISFHFKWSTLVLFELFDLANFISCSFK